MAKLVSDLLNEFENYKWIFFRNDLYPITRINGENLIFIHINKTGGTSINSVLRKKKIHLTTKEILNIIGANRFENSIKFAVVRNPFDRCVSQYYHRVRTNQSKMKENPIEFNDWITKVYGQTKDPLYHNKQYKMFYTQYEWLTDHDDKLNVDYILRFENLENDYLNFASNYGLKTDLPHLNKSNRGSSDYRMLYDQESRSTIEAYFKLDLDYFGYSY